MNEDKRLLKAGLCLLGILAIVVALLRVLAYDPGQARRYVPSGQGSIPTEILEETKQAELLPVSSSMHRDALFPQPAQPVPYQENPTPKEIYSTKRATQPQRYSQRSAVQPPQAFNKGSFNGGEETAPVSYGKPTALPGREYVAPRMLPTTGGIPSSYDTQLQQERARMLAPYLRPNRKEKEQMDAKWQQLSAAIDRAVAQALMPKSKREQNIEKYVSPAGGSKTGAQQQTDFSGPFALIFQQVTAQKQELVHSFDAAFGSSAATQAGQVMDAFSQELADTVNSPDIPPQQMAQRVKDVAKKYQHKMDQLAQKNQYDKFVAQREAQDAQQKQALQEQYKDPELTQKFSQILDQAREKELKLAANNGTLSAEEYFKTLYAQRYETHQQLEQAIRQAQQSLEPLYKLEGQKAQEYLQDLKKQEENGQIISVARAYTEAEQKGIQTHLEKEKTSVLQEITKVYGEDSKADFERLLDQYQQQMLQSAQEELSPAEHQDKQLELTKNFNRQLIQLRMEKIQDMEIPTEQKEKLLDKLRQDYNNIR